LRVFARANPFQRFPLETIQMKNQILLNKINLIVTAMTVLMRGLIPVVYAHNQDWNDGFKSGAVDTLSFSHLKTENRQLADLISCKMKRIYPYDKNIG
jgi:hypothetical protein